MVIGILIAVSINNRTEKQQAKKELDNIFTIIKANLENDIQEVDKVQEYYAKKKKSFNLVLNDSLSKKDYSQNAILLRLILGYPEISFDKRGLNLLSTYNSRVNSSKDTLVNHVVDFYTERLLEINIDDNFRASEFNDNFNHWKNNYDWWAPYIRLTKYEGFIDYALHDADYKNRVATFYFIHYKVFLPELETFETQANSIIAAIDKRSKK